MNKSKKNILALGLIIAAVVSRFLDFAPNFSPFEAISLFGAAVLSSRLVAYLVPIVSIFISDLVLNNTVLRSFYPDIDGFVLFPKYMIFTVVAMIAIVALGRVLLQHITGLKVVFAALASSALFFFITNIGSWLTMPIYSKDLGGLVTALTAGLPFYETSWMSTVLFTCLIFGVYSIVTKYFSKEQAQVA